MRYVLAGAVVLTGIVLVGLAYHDTVAEAWGVLRSSSPSNNPPPPSPPHTPH